jgi:hypothetical protein
VTVSPFAIVGAPANELPGTKEMADMGGIMRSAQRRRRNTGFRTDGWIILLNGCGVWKFMNLMIAKMNKNNYSIIGCWTGITY